MDSKLTAAIVIFILIILAFFIYTMTSSTKNNVSPLNTIPCSNMGNVCNYNAYLVYVSRHALFGGDPSTTFAVGYDTPSYPLKTATSINPITAITSSRPSYQQYDYSPINDTTVKGIANITQYIVIQGGNTNIGIDPSYIKQCTNLQPTSCAFIPSYGTVGTSTTITGLLMNFSVTSLSNLLSTPYSDIVGSPVVIYQVSLVITNADASSGNNVEIFVMALNANPASTAGSISNFFYISPPEVNFILNIRFTD